MVFDSDSEYLIVLDNAEGAVDYSQDLEYLIDLGERSSGGTKKDYVALAGGTSDSENNVQSGIANFKQRNPQIAFIAYYSKRDKSNGSFLDAVDNGDFDLSTFDPRFKVLSVQDVSTSNDSVTVNGDLTERIESGNTIVIDASTGNDGKYNVDTVSYDSGSDETTLELVGNITDSTVDGFISDGVKNVQEQKVWLEEYVFDGRIGEEYELRGQEFQDELVTGRRVVLKNAEIVRDQSQPFTGNGVVKTGEGFNVG